ncbi:hypothetical protein AC579_2916 [Pseudocercospora musae]|uniref:Uncharacterized protein n=1 Tax=Pseudocercospora musae TaxID=113226 RepID=A0A139IUI7_9PEZI|nr:hypothetical protein AC579_2916 [Pseudocercospora musae]
MLSSEVQETNSFTTLRNTSTRSHTTTVMPTPTTMSTSVYPYPSQAKASIETSTPSNTNTIKLEQKLDWYKTYHRNSAIAFSVLAILIVAFIAFKIWRFIRHRKRNAINRVDNATGGKLERTWYGRGAKKVVGRMI